MGHEKLIALATLESGWETCATDRPPLRPVVCVGKVIENTKLPDGRYYLLLCGGKRAHVETELSAPQPFRTAHVKLIEDHYDPGREHDRSSRFKQLAKHFLDYLRHHNTPLDPFMTVLEKGVSFGALTDIVASTMELDEETKYDLLQQLDVDLRADKILSKLVSVAKCDSFVVNSQTCRIFPPKFSDN